MSDTILHWPPLDFSPSRLEPLTFADACNLLERITYKPGWKLRIMPAPEIIAPVGHEPLAMEIAFEYLTHDSHAPHRQTVIYFNKIVPLFNLNGVRFLFLIQNLIAEAEHHEIDEWLRLDGKPLREPHVSRGAP